MFNHTGFANFECGHGHLTIKARIAAALLGVYALCGTKFFANDEKAIAAFNDMLAMNYHNFLRWV